MYSVVTVVVQLLNRYNEEGEIPWTTREPSFARPCYRNTLAGRSGAPLHRRPRSIVGVRQQVHLTQAGLCLTKYIACSGCLRLGTTLVLKPLRKQG